MSEKNDKLDKVITLDNFEKVMTNFLKKYGAYGTRIMDKVAYDAAEEWIKEKWVADDFTTTTGGGVIPEVWFAKVSELAYKAGFARKYTTFIPVDAKTTHIPVLSTDVQFYEVDEGNSITKSNLAISDTQLTLKQWAGIAVAYDYAIVNANINVINYITLRFAQGLARFEDEKVYAAASGCVDSNNIVNVGGTLEYDDLVNVVTKLDDYAVEPVWIVHPTFYAEVKKIKDNNGRPIFNYEEKTILGYPVVRSGKADELATGNLPAIFGDWSKIVLGERDEASIYLSKSANIGGSLDLFSLNASALRYVVYGRAVCVNGKAFAAIKW